MNGRLPVYKDGSVGGFSGVKIDKIGSSYSNSTESLTCTNGFSASELTGTGTCPFCRPNLWLWSDKPSRGDSLFQTTWSRLSTISRLGGKCTKRLSWNMNWIRPSWPAMRLARMKTAKCTGSTRKQERRRTSTQATNTLITIKRLCDRGQKRNFRLISSHGSSTNGKL